MASFLILALGGDTLISIDISLIYEFVGSEDSRYHGTLIAISISNIFILI